jgi:hypothetical protein
MRKKHVLAEGDVLNDTGRQDISLITDAGILTITNILFLM